jgi:hypothetical protein
MGCLRPIRVAAGRFDGMFEVLRPDLQAGLMGCLRSAAVLVRHVIA